MNKRRVTIVTSGHPSSCPRMVKAADAAVEAGYSVRFVSVTYVDWASQLDGDLVARRRWGWHPVRLDRAEHPVASRWASVRYRLARKSVAFSGGRILRAIVNRAYARTHPELLAAILAAPFDFVYGGTVGALAAVADAARRAGKPFGLDFEDYHLAESEDVDAPLTHGLAAAVTRAAQVRATFSTTASGPMARRYAAVLERTPLVVHNVVPLPSTTPCPEVGSGPLRLYWFSQTVAPSRGLEEVVAGVALANVDAALTLRGAARPGYVDALRQLAGKLGARLSIEWHPPAPADQMVDLCRGHAIGLSPEQPSVLNHELCVSNKVLTYLAAGLAVIATDTEGHRSVAYEAPGAMRCYAAGNPESLAMILREWNSCRKKVMDARRASWRAACERFHWEHSRERGVLLDAIARALA